MSVTNRWLCVLLGGLPGLQSCMPFRAEADVAYIQTTLSGDVGLAASGAGQPVNQNLDIQSDLGLSDPSGSLMLRGQVESIIGRFTATGFRYASSGTGTLSGDFGDIPAGSSVDADMSIGNIKAYWSFDLIDLGIWRLSPGLGIDYFDIETTVRSVTPVSAYETITIDAPVPMVFLQTQLDLGIVDAVVDGGAMKVSLNDGSGTYYDVDALVRANLGMFEFVAGYRWIKALTDGVADGQNFDADLQLAGWYLGGGVHF